MSEARLSMGVSAAGASKPAQPKLFSVITRSGEVKHVDFNAVTARLEPLGEGLNHNFVSIDKVAQKTIIGITDGMPTSEIDELASRVAADMATQHPDHNLLAGRISASNLQKTCPSSFVEAARKLHAGDILADDLFEFILANANVINASIEHANDMVFDVFAIITMARSYLLRVDKVLVETPQYMFMRVALAVFLGDLDKALRMYRMLSERMYIHSSPTLFNAGTKCAQLASCFLVDTVSDSIKGIFETLSKCADISRVAGGVGLAIGKVRGEGAYIKGTNGYSTGIVPMLKLYNDTARYVNQAGRRKGSFAIFLQPHHLDMLSFLELKMPAGAEEARTRDLFTAVYASDLFFKHVQDNGTWSFFHPTTAPGLDEAFDDVDNKPCTELYERYEREGLAVRRIRAQILWKAILDAQMESGVPYITNKDQGNRMSNQRNVGPVISSKLCNEIVQHSSPEETAVCNLASLCLVRFFDETTRDVDYRKLAEFAGYAIEALNNVIDRSIYPTPCAERSNMRHKPLGLGVSGLQDLLFKLRLPFDSAGAREVNKKVFEAIYFGAMQMSVELARCNGPYASYEGSPLSKGTLACDLWGSEPQMHEYFDWEGLRRDLAAFGARNSLLIALMPTASSSTLLGVNECFEPITANVYLRKTLSGEFVLINRYLVQDLCERGIWSNDLAQQLIAANGSVSEIEGVPAETKALYRTAWEISNRAIIDMAAERHPWVCQSQSMNLFLKHPTASSLTRMYYYAFNKGLKSIVYYLRMQPKALSAKFSVPAQRVAVLATSAEADIPISSEAPPPLVCTVRAEGGGGNDESLQEDTDDDICLACST